MDVNQIGVLLMGAVLGWLLIFAVRRYRVQWGAFALFMSILFGVGLLGWLYVRDLLAWYAIGLFAGFFGNLVTRAVGTAIGGRLGQGLLEISAVKADGSSKGNGERARQP